MSTFKFSKSPAAPVRKWKFGGGVLASALARTLQTNKSAAQTQTPTPKSPLLGKTVFFRLRAEGETIAGVITETDGTTAKVKLCLPNADGILVMSQTSEVSVPLHDLTQLDAEVVKNRDVKAYSENALVMVGEKATPVMDPDESGTICDYRDVTFSGMASTFQAVTPEDRDGDYILPGAFSKWIAEFRRNPVMLSDHDRSVKNLMGHYTKVSVIADRGLAVEGMVTNSPHKDAKHIRFQLVEQSLKTLSIGGSFFYLDDMRGIEEIRLHEISLVVVPANPDAVITTRSLTGEHAEKAFKAHTQQHGGQVRAGIRLKNLA